MCFLRSLSPHSAKAHSTERGSGSPAEPLCGQWGWHSVHGALESGASARGGRERSAWAAPAGTASPGCPHPQARAVPAGPFAQPPAHVPPGGPLLHPDKAPRAILSPCRVRACGIARPLPHKTTVWRKSASAASPRNWTRTSEPAFPFPRETPGSLPQGQERNALAELADWMGERSGRSEH